MSRISNRLRTLRKTSARIGFGVTKSSVADRRMLVLAGARGIPVAELLSNVRGSADAIVLDEGQRAEISATEMTAVSDDMIVGARLENGAQLPESLADAGYDFATCDVDGPMELLSLKAVGCLVQVGPGVESNRLHAIGDIGVDAVVLLAESMDMGTVDAAIECRRMRTVSGKPIIVHLTSAVSAEQISVLWRAGVDAVFVDASEGVELLKAIRAAVDSASYESRSSSRDTSVAIGANMTSMNAAIEEEEAGEEEGEEEDDE